MISNYINILHLIYTMIFSSSIILGGEAIFTSKAAKLFDNNINQSNIILGIESDEDIYGIQLDLKYNPSEISFAEDGIISKVPDIKLYSIINDSGNAKILMFGLLGEKILNANLNREMDIIEIRCKQKERFTNITVVELINIKLAGKAGEEIPIINGSIFSFKISFIVPHKTILSTNHPNPFNSYTTIDYSLSSPGDVSLIIYDLNGTIIRTLIDEYMGANYHSIIWYGFDENGQAVPSGKYILKMSTFGFTDNITMTRFK